MKRSCLILLLTISLYACNDSPPAIQNKFVDPVLIKIADLQDRRMPDSLHNYLLHENPVYRRNAVVAFASIQDTSSASKIGELLLRDSDSSVRSAAAFALGQTRSMASGEILRQALRTEKSPVVLREILEGYGKVLNKKFSGISRDSSQCSGSAWMYYRLMIQGSADTALVKTVAQYLDNSQNTECRLGASHFFARSRFDIGLALDDLILSAQYDSSGYIRMASALGLGKILNQRSLDVLKTIVLKDRDYRVRVNAVRSLQSFPFEETNNVLFQSLQDTNVTVGVASSEVIKSILTKKFSNEALSKARLAKNWRIQANLFESVLSVSETKELVEEIQSIYNASENDYQRAALLTSLGQTLSANDFLRDQLLHSDVPVIKSSAASALVTINRRKNFPYELRRSFADLYVTAIQKGDPAVIGIIAEVLTDTTLAYKTIISDHNFLYEAKQKLSLPKDNEALQPLEAAIAYFEGNVKSKPVINDFNHPIDWDIVKSTAKEQKAIIKTSKGNITLKLLVEEAPGSVANFIDLTKKNYFDSKFFHRVVPNFVIQAGCNRGDGWGSEDYSIRSEFSTRRYSEGSVGMASAGKDTEGTQWFITHSPTPHLDGRYTIFAIVEAGMEIVHQIEVGDQILDIELVK